MWNQEVFAPNLKMAPPDSEPCKVAWISPQDTNYTSVKSLVDHLHEAGLAVTPVLPIGLGIARILDHQLIVIETGDRLDSALLQLTVSLLVRRFAVIVVLMDQPTSQQIIQALALGADAVWTKEESGDVLCARAEALLNRRFKRPRKKQINTKI